jgi:hypothetical protein
MKSLLKEFEQARVNLSVAKKQLMDATVKAFPLGTRVVSYARKNPIDGEVVGHGQSHYPDSILVRNNRTGKVHRAYPGLGWDDRPGVVVRPNGGELAGTGETE